MSDTRMLFPDGIEIVQGWQGEVENNQGSRTLDREYTITGTTDELTAYFRFSEYLYTRYPVVSGMRIETFGVSPKQEGAELFIGSVRYSTKANEGKLTLPVQSFSTKGGTAKQTHSWATVQAVARDGFVAPNFGRGIGVKDGTLEGCDVITPNYTTSFARKGLPHAFVTYAYRNMLQMMTGTVNATPFDGMAPGECMFMGADVQQNITNEEGLIESTWDITWEFRASPNMGGFVAGPGFPPVDKRGFDYLWLHRIMQDDEESGQTIPIPVAVYVEQVYMYSNFMALGIF